MEMRTVMCFVEELHLNIVNSIRVLFVFVFKLNESKKFKIAQVLPEA